MYRLLSCLPAQHDHRLVLLAALICAGAAVASLKIYSHTSQSHGLRRLALLVLTGISTGAGIWATHFVAMLAYEPGIPTAYDTLTTAASLVVAVLATTAGFAISGNNSRWLQMVGGGGIGAGIGLMHYTGMAALAVAGTLQWSVPHVVASLAVGVTLAAAAIITFHRSHGRRSLWLSASLLALAVCSLHFTAMSAVTIDPDPTIAVSPSQIGASTMAIAVSGAALLIMLSAVTATAIMENQTRRRREKELEIQNLRFDAALSNMGAGLCMFDAAKRLVVWNDRYARLYRLPPELLKPGTAHDAIIAHRVSTGVLRGDSSDTAVAQKIAALAQLPANASSSRIEELADGRLICITREAMPGGGWVAIHEDVTTLKKMNLELEKSNRLLNERSFCLQSIVDNFPGGITLLDADLRVVVTNDAARRLLDLPHCLFADGPPLLEDIFRFNAKRGEYGPGDVGTQVAERMTLARAGQAHLFERERPDGTVIEVRGFPLPDGGFVTTYMDVTERKRADAKIAHMARHDALTDLANRALLNQQLEHALEQVKGGQMAAVHLVDLDGFKGVNDTLGHPAGDALLKIAATRLAAIVRNSDTIARLGGDEFAILQMPIGEAAEATALATRIIETLGSPYELEDRFVSVGASVGIAVAPSDGLTSDELMRSADLALYHAKGDGRGQYRLFQDVSAQIRDRSELLCDLRTAIAAGQFEVHYQPMVSIASRRWVAMEALIRWRHPAHGLISPERFIPLAEETGLISLIGEQVLRQACSDALRWPECTKVSVNVSPVQFRGGDLAGMIARTLAETGLPPERLELEITETLLLQGTDQNFAILHQLRGLGVTIALDDFGTGYSSLSYLRAFPLDKIKVDKSFVSEITTRDECAAIVCTIANLGRSLGITTVAEGIESERQLELVRAAGVTQAQGFLFARPRPAADLCFADNAVRLAATENAA